jgi:hypothetical protein
MKLHSVYFRIALSLKNAGTFAKEMLELNEPADS